MTKIVIKKKIESFNKIISVDSDKSLSIRSLLIGSQSYGLCKIKNFSNNHKLGCFVQKNFLYKINLLNINEPKWYGTRISKKKYLNP